MSEQSLHPTPEELSAYSLGQLPQERAVAIDSHISECQPCCETIVSLSSDDTFVGLLKEARQLPAEQTPTHESLEARPSSFHGDIPPELAGHPRYEIIRLIGKGGMGDVYEAIHRKMERRVALKVINRGLFQKAEAVNRFHREVTTAAQLSHPNIVTAHDADQAGDHHFMVMEFVDGVDLSQVVKDQGALPIADACDHIRQAAIGLQHAHERGMVHRDIKPHNLMVTSDGIVKILDFGLASLAPEAIPESDTGAGRSDLTAAGAIMGTPDFISPEQASDARQADIRSDIYSLGATFYYLLSGRVPFDDGSVMHKLRSHAQVEPAPLNSLRDDVPEELVAIASRMMAKDPNERYLTPKDVADALESFLRTWQPGEENSLRKDASNGGNDSGSGGQRPVPDDSNPSWLPVVGKLLLYTSLLPMGLCVVNEFVPFGLFSSETDWFWYCLLTSIALSTIGATMFGLNQGLSNIGGGQQVNGKATDHTLLIIMCLAVSAFGILNHLSNGNGHIEVTPQSDRTTLGTHLLTIIDTSGEKPLGGTTSTHQDDASGITTHSFKSANGRYNITLVDGVLTVNGERYTLENPADAIRIVDDRVEITQVTELPDVVSELPADGNHPVIASTSTNNPELKITSKTVNKGTSGLPSVYDWDFKGRDVGDLKVRLLLAQNGKTEVMQEFDFEELPPEFVNKVRLEVRDDATGSNHKRRVTAILFVVSPVPSRSATVNEDKGLSIDVEAPFSNRIQRADLASIDPEQTELVLALSYWKGDMNHNRSMESMTAATKDGNATFLFVTLDWSPGGELSVHGKITDQMRDADAATRKAGQQRSDNQLKMPLCWCPAGEFKMGREQLPVTLTHGFWMGKYEVTQAQYVALMGDNPSENKGESLPVEKVGWNEAKKFCQKFTELERKAGRLPKGWEYRLPTEAQWEYACRAGTTLVWDDEKALVYPSTFGDDLSELGDYAWYSENSDGTPHPVGQKKPNAWGLCDMYGNVREWVRDAWQSKLFGGNDPEIGASSPVHTQRGGDWLSFAEPCGSPFNRGIGVAGREAHMMGFRVALVPVVESEDGVEATQQESDANSFSYDLSQVPTDAQEIYGYRPHQIREDGRFKRILESLDQSAPNQFLMDQNLEQVLNLQWANDDRTYSQPLVVLTVREGTATEFASKHLGVKTDGAIPEAIKATYYPIKSGKFFPMPEEQFVRFVDDKTMILSTREFLDAHQIALKKQPNTELLKIAASMPDALLWVIGNTTDKDYVEQIKFRYSQSPLAAVLMTQLPIWEDTNYLTLSLVGGEDPNLQLAAHAPAAELQDEITQTVRTLPVTLANLLRPFSDGSGPADAKTIDALIGALGETEVTEPSGTESRLTISLKAAEPHLLRLLNSWFVDLEQAKSAAYKAASVGNLRQIGLAFQFFEQEHGYLPSVTTKLPGAKHPVSWRVAILKYLDERLYNQYNLEEPWDSENNKKLLEELPSFYRHPGQEKGISNTCYVTLVGDNTATGDGNETVNLHDDISDGPQQTILVTEGFTHTPWTKPEDLKFEDGSTLPPVHPHPDGWNVILVDGSAQFISSDTSADVLKALITRNGGEAIESEDGVWKKALKTNKPTAPTTPAAVIRQTLLPEDIAAEGAGWERFRKQAIGERGGVAFGVPENLRPLLAKLPQPKLSLQKLADDVESAVKQHPQWKAGWAVLGFVEAELGNEERAVELFKEVLTEREHPITPQAAWMFGLALEGKGKELDLIVTRLYEINVDGERDPSSSLRESAIGSLARLYAKHDRQKDAQGLLQRLTKPEGPDVVCAWARGPLFSNRCTECHQQERSLENYILMANGLTDIGSPVEARMSLARISASFKNAYDSDEAWAEANTIVPDWEYQGKEAFQPARAKAESRITPQLLHNALVSGLSIDSDSRKTVIGKSASSIDLMLGVRGQDGKSTLFSPVIDMLDLVAQAKGEEPSIANVRIDHLLADAFERDPDQLEVGIAATLFAFQRNDLDAAEKRLKTLQKPLPHEEQRKAAVGLWLVAREALKHERTREIGAQLAERALAAANEQDDPLWTKAILIERQASEQTRSKNVGKADPPKQLFPER